VREVIAEGKLGEIVLATGMFCSSVLAFYKGQMHGIKDTDSLWDPGAPAYSEPARGGGHAHTQLTHCAGLLFHLTGLRPDRVAGLASNQGTKVDVCDVFSFGTAGGATGTISGTGTVPPGHQPIEEYRIFGTRGSVTLDTVLGRAVIEVADEPIRRPRPLPPDARYPADATAARLVDTRLGRAPVLVPGELGLLVAEFLVAGLTSAASGRPEPLDQPASFPDPFPARHR
jgi:predicted dehydrogenase